MSKMDKTQLPCDECQLPASSQASASLKIAFYKKHRKCLKSWLQTIEDVNCVFGKQIEQWMIGVNPYLPNTCIYGITVTPLMLAAEYNFPDVIESLVDSGADVNKMCNNLTALYYAVMYCHEHCVNILLHKHATRLMDKEQSHSRLALLHNAAACGWKQVLKILIDEETDLNTTTCWPFPAILTAVSRDHVDLVKLMIEAGADVNKCNSVGETVFHVAKSAECMNVLLAAGADVHRVSCFLQQSPLHVVHNVECARKLLQMGCSLEVEDSTENTPLVSAIITKKQDVVQFLLENGATVTENAVICCAIDYNDTFLKQLLKYGGNVNAGHRGRGSALYQASKECPECIRQMTLLLQSGAHVNTYSHFFVRPIAAETKYSDKMSQRSKLLLFAAGEKLKKTNHGILPDEMKYVNSLELRHICRQAIRNHMLEISDTNLFVRIPNLGLPLILTNYLLYNVTLDDF